ncbi:NUDIX hydrolase [Denitromonas iodatirespirans]|uniref:NUDIX hydrolase n=1 Tax=Denitromonas iodatirespirans TaxID=2795389 RepID=A0A944DC62_DENI1|nr:NUDIX hydrolase [Denitromonas iodatirespirans]MBT0963545.1 NUDIX hydrolase [Denitromonas iodatirespirans]
MKFCSACGATVSLRVPAGDALPRHVCDDCGEIHYLNPKMVVGAIPVWGDRILLCRRAIEPRYGKWTLPAGFMENRETTAQAAARETLEEACARIRVGPLFALVNIPEISQVHLFYRAELQDADFAAGAESLEVALFHEAEIPWDTLAFRSVTFALKRFLEDRRNERYGVHTEDLALARTSLPEGT